ncbi:hypothetical protein WJX72_011914 [[Myrmecia] bisecta]|uniref:Pseudouridine synthase I TruA alpha/beta domain-containing protein n=1 Tax=[Myrmecia] bisecta TaxID=41462 RepID=A0AAW1PTG7_9CHLO
MEAEQPDQVVAGSVLPAVSPPAEPEAQADQAAKENLAVLEPNSDTVTADAASTAQEGVQANASGDAPAKPKFEGGRKRKVALHLAYVGEGYLGMQRNPGCKTIEGDLFDALHKSGCISDENAADFNKVHWMRAARTDKGVSAIGQVVSLKMAIEFPNLIERINAQLPSAIRVLGCTRVTNGFDARKLCDRRRYDSAFVFNEACQERLNRILGMYVGTHNFHNFTVRMAAEDPASRRYILSFQCEPITVEGQAWVRMVVIGQSFILHQIRKMVGLAVAVMRNIAPEESIRLALDRSRYVNTPMAPELGLFLDECYFHSYNDRWGNERDERITLEGYQEVIAEFKNKRLYPHIANKDGAEQVNATWLRSLNERNHQFSLWGTAEVLRPRAEQQGGYSRQQQAAQGDDMDAEAGTSGAAAIVGSMETYGMGRGGRGGFSGKRKPDFRDQRHDVKRGRGRGRGGGRQGGPEYRGAPSAGLSRKVAQSVDAEWSD